MELSTPISELTRVGKTIAKKMEYLGVENAQDLLYYFPFRYEDYRQILPIAQLRAGQLVTVRAQVELIANKRSWRGRKTVTEALVSDETGSLRITWFNQPFLVKNIHVGEIVYFSGKVQADKLGPKLVSPVYEKYYSVKRMELSVIARSPKATEAIPLDGSANQGIVPISKIADPVRYGAASVASGDPPRNDKQTVHTARLVPIYPLTTGLTQKQIRFLISQTIGLADKIGEWLSQDILEQADLAPLSSALRGIHFPVDENDLKLSADRLKFDELFLVQLRAELARQERSALAAPVIHFKEEAIKKFVAGLPFVLTKPQKISAWEILQDIAKPAPMNRLLSGDVGSGKTVVAAMAMYNNFLNGYQSALMVPTEILAQQHYGSLVKLFEGLNVTVGLLTGSRADVCHCEERSDEAIPSNASANKNQGDCHASLAMTKKAIVAEVSSGKLNIVVGTHALFSEGVKYKKLGLVIVDEQHRFGVEQRKTIKEKGKGVHFLSMTATPIPRSLALMIYGDLDISIINELPPGRKKIITKIVEPIKREKAYQFIREQIKQGRQAFVICPLIEVETVILNGAERSEESLSVGELRQRSFVNTQDDNANSKKSVMSEYEKLSKKIFTDLRVGYLHGKLKPLEKEETMSNFKNGKIDLLVTTSVIEVGVDIPNASVMMIEGAESFGLAQLHQFRGRVGRSVHQSYCILFSNSNSTKAKERFNYFEQTNDGFKLAEKDLAMRGPGEVYGTEQSGEMGLRLAKLTDFELIKKARQAAQMVAANIAKYPEMLAKIEDLEKTFHLE